MQTERGICRNCSFSSNRLLGEIWIVRQKKKKKKNISEKMKVLYSFRHKTRLDTRTRITWSRKALIKKNKQTNTRRLITVVDLWDCELLHRFFFSLFTIKTQTNIVWHDRLAWFISESSLIMSRPWFHYTAVPRCHLQAESGHCHLIHSVAHCSSLLQLHTTLITIKHEH